MDSLGTLSRLTQIEILKFWRKSTARVVLVFMFIGPILGEAALASFSIRDATFPQITQFMFSSDMLMMIALMMVVISVMALGNDYELGTVSVIISRGVDRYQFIFSKIIATVCAALINGLVFMIAAFASTYVVHVTYSDVPFVEAAGGDIFWRLLGATGVIGLVNFVLSGVVMLALVVGRSSWVGMLAGLGSFLVDFFLGGLGIVRTGVHRYTVTFQTVSLLARRLESGTGLRAAAPLAGHSLADPGRALATLILYGCALTLAAIIIFGRQDLMVKN